MAADDRESWNELRDTLTALPSGQDGEAVNVLQQALPLAMQFGDGDERLAWTSYMLGVCLYRQARYSEAKRHLKRAASIYETVPGKQRWSGKALAWLCHAEKITRAPISKFESYARRALDFLGEPDAAEKEDQFHVAELLELLGEHYARLGQHKDAITCIDRLLLLLDRGHVADEGTLGRLITATVAGQLSGEPYQQLVERMHRRVPAKPVVDTPYTQREELVESIHGIEVSDAYRWLEEPSQERQQWMQEQNDFAQLVLDGCAYKSFFLAESRRLFFVQRYSNPYRRGSRIFYGLAQPKDRQEVLYTVGHLGQYPRTIIDPGKENLTVTGAFASRDGEWLAYSLSRNGSDWQSWKIRHVHSGRDLDDTLVDVRARYLCWCSNNRDFLYAGYARLAGENIPIICKHTLRTSQSDDEVIYRGQVGQYIQPFAHGKHLFVSTFAAGVDGNEILYARTDADGEVSFDSVFPGQQANYKINGWQGWRLLFVTDHEAPRRKLISLDVNTGERFTEIEETEDVLETVFPVSDGYVAHYISDSSSKLVHIGKNGRRDVPVMHAPSTIGSVTWLDKDVLSYSVEGLALPRTIYRLDVTTGESKAIFPAFDHVDPDKYTVKQVFLSSKDGTRISMFIGHKNGLQVDPDTPTWLTGYGGFRHINSPRYMFDRLVWMDLGGVVVTATIRGGSEYGEDWHRQGSRELKQNAFDDFIACAEYLLDNGLTSKHRLAISGSSNGGLLMAAVLTQRPDLFGAVCLGSPLTDMMRYHKFNFAHEWITEYGSSENADDSAFLAKYSPLHNVKAVEYPATFIQVGATDDRVDPLHSYKFAAALQKAQQGPAPIIVKTYERLGHSVSCSPTWFGVDQLSFLAHAVKLTDRLK